MKNLVLVNARNRDLTVLGFSDDRITENGDSRFTEDGLYERVTQ